MISNALLKRIIFYFLSICIWIFLLDFGQAESPTNSISSQFKHALIIGISKYKHWDEYKGGVADAKNIAQTLTTYYNFDKKNIILITDQDKIKPTRENILFQLDNYRNKLTNEDDLLIFYSGRSYDDPNTQDTYWIPYDGDQESNKMKWLKHADLCSNFFTSKHLLVKNLSIITDSYFSTKLLKSKPNIFSIYDMPFQNRIIERSHIPSRELIATNDTYRGDISKTDGMGIFTYYLCKTLFSNEVPIIDIENLVSDLEKMIIPVSCVSGSKIIRRRLDTDLDKGGQFVIARTKALPKIDIIDISTNQLKSRKDNRYIIEAHTNKNAKEVYINYNDKTILMKEAFSANKDSYSNIHDLCKRQRSEDNGNKWEHVLKTKQKRKIPIGIFAVNANDIPGPEQKTFIISSPAKPISISNIEINGQFQEEEYSFIATTDLEPINVIFILDNVKYNMIRSHNKWILKKEMNNYGSFTYHAHAVNEDNIEGPMYSGSFSVKESLVNIKNIKISSQTLYKGDTLNITVDTDKIADSAYIEIDKTKYAFTKKNNQGTNWYIDLHIQAPGTKIFTVFAHNISGLRGASKKGELYIKEKPEIEKVEWEPKEIKENEPFTISVSLEAPADLVTISISGKDHIMDGNTTNWSYKGILSTYGKQSYTITPENKDGVKGKPKKGFFYVTKYVAPKVDVIQIGVNPEVGYEEDYFLFSATTNRLATKVEILSDNNRWLMTGQDRTWTKEIKFNKFGSKNYEIIAYNEEGVKGSILTGTFVVHAKPVAIDNIFIIPEKIEVDDNVTINAKTNLPASTVYAKIDKISYNMIGRSKDWKLERNFEEPGKKEIIFIALNAEKKETYSESYYITVYRKKPDIERITIDPEKIYQNTDFIIKAETNYPAKIVNIKIHDEIMQMEGSEKQWSFKSKIADIGDFPFTIIAYNEDNEYGNIRNSNIIIEKEIAEAVNVVSVNLSKQKGFQGDTFGFFAETNSPAQKVFITINKVKFEMQGYNTKWEYFGTINEIGAISFSVYALNDDEIQGKAKPGVINVYEKLPNTVRIWTKPKVLYLNEMITIFSQTDNKASSAFITIDNKTFEMSGKEKEWLFEKRFEKPGIHEISVNAKNSEGEVGSSNSITIDLIQKPDVIFAKLNQDDIYVNTKFQMYVSTISHAKSVNIEINGQSFSMKGSDKNWSYETQINKAGTHNFIVTAQDKYGNSGKPKKGIIDIKEAIEDKPVNITSVQVEPEEGIKGDTFIFSASTSNNASKVFLIINNKRYKMKGLKSNQKWLLKKKINDVGKQKFDIVAYNNKGEKVKNTDGSFNVKPKPVEPVEIKNFIVNPQIGKEGETFSIYAKTKQKAQSVSIIIDGITYSMIGSNKDWSLKTKIPGYGKKSFIIMAINTEGLDGIEKTGTLLIKQKIPDIVSVMKNKEKLYIKEDFMIEVTTSSPASSVIIEINENKYNLKGDNLKWILNTSLDKIGSYDFNIYAKNNEGNVGKNFQGTLELEKRPLNKVNVVKISCEPNEGESGSNFSFTAYTNIPAHYVKITIDSIKYNMSAEGNKWTYSTKINKVGKISYSISAYNKENSEGLSKASFFEVTEAIISYKYIGNGKVKNTKTGEILPRFIDNNNGTVIDRYTSLMWLKKPYTIEMDWNKAVSYCNNLNFQGETGWRLPSSKEWEQLIDRKRKDPSLPKNHPFVNVLTIKTYWSKSDHTFSGSVYEANLYNGKTKGYLKKTDFGYTWPVKPTIIPR